MIKWTTYKKTFMKLNRIDVLKELKTWKIFYSIKGNKEKELLRREYGLDNND